MRNRFPSSPYAGHAFKPYPEIGNLYDETGEQAWIVVLQRNGDVRGPMPALRYVPVQRGIPTDVIAYHEMNQQEAEAIAAEFDKTDVVSTRRQRMLRKAVPAVLGTGLIALAGAFLLPRIACLKDDA